MDLNDYRLEIDRVDRKLIELFLERTEIVKRIGAYKQLKGLPVYDPEREQAKLNATAAFVPPESAEAVRVLFETIFALSRQQQVRERE